MLQRHSIFISFKELLVWYGNAYGSILKSILSLNEEDKQSNEKDESSSGVKDNEGDDDDAEAKKEDIDKDDKNGLFILLIV